MPHRLELIRNGRISIIDDTYNGNPVGAKRALEVLREFDGRRVVVTPGLVELGKREKEENEKLGKEIANVANLALIIGRNGEYIRKGLIENGFPEENALFFKNCLTPKGFSRLVFAKRRGAVSERSSRRIELKGVNYEYCGIFRWQKLRTRHFDYHGRAGVERSRRRLSRPTRIYEGRRFLHVR